MPPKTKPTEHGISAAANTYRRCARLLANTLGMEPVTGVQSGRKVFDLTLERIPQHISAQVPSSFEEDNTENDNDEAGATLDQEDFSPNQVLWFMRRTANKLAKPRSQKIERAAFLREVNKTLESDGGLVVITKFNVNAKGGRAGWIRNHMKRFFHRHEDIVQVVDGQPGLMNILGQSRR